MNVRSLKQYAKYAAPIASVVILAASVLAAPVLKSDTTTAAAWETQASCKAKYSAAPDYMRCLNQDSYEGMVFRAYQTVLGRTPDKNGFDGSGSATDKWDGWVGVAKANPQNPTLAVVSGMMRSPEYGNKYMTENTQLWVQELYQRALYRNGSNGEVNYWVSQVNNRRMTHQQVAAFFTQSEEQKRLTANSVPCYVTNRDPNYCFDH